MRLPTLVAISRFTQYGAPNKRIKPTLRRTRLRQCQRLSRLMRDVVAGRFAPGNNAADFIRWLFGAKRLTTSKFT